MDGKVVVFAVPIVFFITIAVVIIAVIDYRLKKHLIDSGHVNDMAVRFFTQKADPGQKMLKWGLILLFGGLGLIVNEFIPFHADQSPLPYGIEAVFVAMGFLLYYLLVRKSDNNSAA